LPAASFSASLIGLQFHGDSAGKGGIYRKPGAPINRYCSGYTREVMISTDLSTGQFPDPVFSLKSFQSGRPDHLGPACGGGKNLAG